MGRATYARAVEGARSLHRADTFALRFVRRVVAMHDAIMFVVLVLVFVIRMAVLVPVLDTIGMLVLVNVIVFVFGAHIDSPITDLTGFVAGRDPTTRPREGGCVGQAVRFASTDDAPGIAQIYAPFVATTTISFEEVPPDAGEMRQRIIAARDIWPWLVSERDGAVAGFAYAGPHRNRAAYRWSVDVSTYVAPPFQRRGIARGLYETLFRVLVVQGYYQALAGITLPNDASVGLHRSAGFEPVGTYRNVGYKFGAWHDVLWLARPLRPFDTEPAEPRPLATLARPELERALRVGSQ